MTEKVIVAMSGGVDSSVAALLLKEQGYDVVGVMLSLWSESVQDGKNACCTPDAVAGARRVAAILDIPFYVMDAREPFHTHVVQNFLSSYLSGETPNPCIVCNQRVRWGYLLDLARKFGAKHLATGHYAQLRKSENELFELLQAVDLNKDQTYMLSGLNQEQLRSTLFPLGKLTKPEVRELAKNNNFPVADRRESQDLCFIGDLDYRSFLKKYSPTAIESGEIVDIQGNILGTHQGLPFYTIGQRKGIQIAGVEPYYVVRKDQGLNRLVVGHRSALGSTSIRSDGMNWIAGNPPDSHFTANIKVRYRSKSVKALIEPKGKTQVHIMTETPLPDITPGQQVVIYSGVICLGGGKISAVGEES